MPRVRPLSFPNKSSTLSLPAGDTGFTLVGRLGRVKGLKGEIKLNVSIALPRIPRNVKILFVFERGSFVPCPLSSFKISTRNVLVHFTGLDDLDKIRSFVGKEVFMPSSQLEAAELSFADLTGFLAVDNLLGVLGEIFRVDIYPQQLIALIDFNGTEILVPLNEETVKNVNHLTHTVTLELPLGLIEIFTVKF